MKLYMYTYTYMYRQIPVIALPSSAITNELAEIIITQMTSQGPGQIANDLEKFRVARWVHLGASYLELETFWKSEKSKGKIFFIYLHLHIHVSYTNTNIRLDTNANNYMNIYI
jgi:hypothetical protein